MNSSLSIGSSLLEAVVVPTIPKEVTNIIANFKLWDQREFWPFETLPEQPKLDLIFVYGQLPDPSIIDKIVKAFQETTIVQKCFKKLLFWHADLTDEENIYSLAYLGQSRRRILKNSPNGGYKVGPNNVFFYIMQTCQSYRNIFLMESDCRVVKRNWLGAIDEFVNRCHDRFWICGSIYRGFSLLEKKVRFHINGNAIYATGDPIFSSFVLHDFRKFLTREVKIDPLLAYDTCMFYYLNHPENWPFSQQHFHRFIYTDLIQNYSGDPTLTGGDRPNLYDVKKQYPNTYILHGKLVRDDMILVEEPTMETPKTEMVNVSVSSMEEMVKYLSSTDKISLSLILRANESLDPESILTMNQFEIVVQQNIASIHINRKKTNISWPLHPDQNVMITIEIEKNRLQIEINDSVFGIYEIPAIKLSYPEFTPVHFDRFTINLRQQKTTTQKEEYAIQLV